MACGYCAPVKRHRSWPLFAKCTNLSKAFPAYSSRPSSPPLSLPLVRVWGFSSPSLECGGDLWMLLQQRHLLRWIFPFSLFLKKGGVMSSRPRLGHFFPSSSVFHAVAEWQILRIESRAKIVDVFPHCTCVTASPSHSGAIWRLIWYGASTKVSH